MNKLETKLLGKIREAKYPERDANLFKKWLNFSKEFLKDKKRKSGELEINHNIRIALSLIKSNLSKETICAGLLYRAESYFPKAELEKEFGKEISKIVIGQKILKEIKSKAQLNQTTAIRQILLTSIEDLRILFVKLAAKLDNIKNIGALPNI